jgi:hypothetical protein
MHFHYCPNDLSDQVAFQIILLYQDVSRSIKGKGSNVHNKHLQWELNQLSHCRALPVAKVADRDPNYVHCTPDEEIGSHLATNT